MSDNEFTDNTDDSKTVTITVTGAFLLAAAIGIGMTIGGIGRWGAEEILDHIKYGNNECVCKPAPMPVHIVPAPEQPNQK